MGQDKALLPVGESNGGGTLLDFMQRKLEATGRFDEIVVCRNAEAGGRSSTKYLADINPNLGPVAALYTLSIHFANRRALVVPIDMPLLELGLLRKLGDVKTDQWDAVIFEQHYFPLLIQFNAHVNKQLAKRVNTRSSERSVAALLKDVETKQLMAPENLSQFTNINTVNQWHEALQIIRQHSQLA